MREPRQLHELNDDLLPEDSAEDAEAVALELKLQQLDALGAALAAKRKAAIEARDASGIEQIWDEDDDAYEGVDDANRAEEHYAARGQYNKPTSMSGTLTTGNGQRQVTKSNVFLNITAPYVDGAAARVGDMLLPSDDKPWGIDPTPVPEFTEAVESEQDVSETISFNGEEIAKADIARKALEVAQARCERAETRIDDWLTESNFAGEVRNVIECSSRLGTGILKGPFPVNRKRNVWKRAEGGVMLEQLDETKPASYSVDCRNLYPDAGCGENIHNGNYFWERDDLTKKTLRDFRTQQGYIVEQINACLTEGPIRPEVERQDPTAPNSYSDEANFEVWYYYGFVDREDMMAAGCDCSMFAKDEHAAIPALITMVNNRVIKAALNPLDTADFPFDFVVWKKRRGTPWGMGVSRQCRTPQRMINAATRNMMDNAALSGGPQIVILQGAVTPLDGTYELYPRKVWLANPEAQLQDLKAAFMSVNIDCNQADLMAIIEFGLRMAEQVTGMPAIVQGQQGDAPELVGVVTIMNNNANAVLRRIARTFDDQLFKPHIERYYTYLMQHGEDDEEKGLFIVRAKGTSVLVERDIQNQAILQMSAMALNPAFRIDPVKYRNQALKAQRLRPKDFEYSDEDWKKLQDEAANGPSDPRIAVAQMQLQWKEADAQRNAQLKQLEMQFAEKEANADRHLQILLKGMEAEVRQADAKGAQVIDLAKIKAALATVGVQERNKAALQSREIAVKERQGSGI